MQDSRSITTKKLLKRIIGKYNDGKGGCGYSKKDGRGGFGIIDPPGYGKIVSKPAVRMTSKPHRASVKIGGIKMKGIKRLSSIASIIGSSNKGTNFGKVLKSMRSKGLKSMIKSII